MARISKAYIARMDAIKNEGYACAERGGDIDKDNKYFSPGDRNAWLIGFRNYWIQQENKHFHARNAFINALLKEDKREELRVLMQHASDDVRAAFEVLDALPTPTTSGGFKLSKPLTYSSIAR